MSRGGEPPGAPDTILIAKASSRVNRRAELLRQKFKVLVAFGSCACEGCIPGLANLTTTDEILDYAYRKSPSVEAGNTTLPQTVTETLSGRLTLPALHDVLRPLDQVVDVDFRIPGCPHTIDRRRHFHLKYSLGFHLRRGRQG